MLEAISDFWKPAKKNQPQEKLNPDQLQTGSTIGFGFVPQASISGRRLQVIGINTYRFGEEALTSFVLGQDKETAASMIVAEAEGEHYLALSRRITISDRMKMFDSADLDNVIAKPDITQLPCKDNLSDFKGWTVPSYKREIHGMKGAIFKGDFRKSKLPAESEAQSFTYTLLVSDTNEHAIEIEKYNDGRVEMYATVYRRITDIGEITHPTRSIMDKPDIKIASADTENKPAAPLPPQPSLSSQPPSKPVDQPKPQVASAPAQPQPVITPAQETPKVEPVVLRELKPEPKLTASSAAPVATTAPAAPAPEQKPQPAIDKPVAEAKPNIPTKEEKPAMPATEPYVNGAAKPDYKAPSAAPVSETKPSSVLVQSTAPSMYHKQEIKAVSNVTNGMENESVECDLRVANKIIDEAIRNEMRLSDIVRRIIELPVAYPEAVQIPITLSDEDYQLLAIRYGIPAADRNTIKSRIIEDLNNFSGPKKQ